MLADSTHIRTVPLQGGFLVVLDLTPFDFREFFPDLQEFGFRINERKQLSVLSSLADLGAVSRFRPPLRFLYKNPRRKGRWVLRYGYNPLETTLGVLLAPEANLALDRHAPAWCSPERYRALREERVQEERDVRRLSAQEYKEWARKQNARQAIRARQARNLYNALWRRVVPLLDAEALRMTRAAQGDLALYNLLAENEDLKRWVRRSPVIGVFLNLDANRVPEDLTLGDRSLEEVLLHLSNREHLANGGRVPGGRLLQHWHRVPPAFLAWAERAHFTPPYVGGIDLNSLLQGMWLEANNLTPADLDALTRQKDWYTFHSLIIEFRGLIRPFLNDPEDGRRIIDEVAPQEKGHSHLFSVATFANKVYDYAVRNTAALPDLTLRQVYEQSRQDLEEQPRYAQVGEGRRLANGDWVLQQGGVGFAIGHDLHFGEDLVDAVVDLEF